MSANFYELLKYAATGQASPSMTYYDKARASTLMGGVVQTLNGIPPLSFPSDGSPLISWSMKGNGSQQGTPTPDNPVMPEFVGEKTGNLMPVTSFTGKSNSVMESFNSESANIVFEPNTQYAINFDFSANIQTGVFKVTFYYTDETSTSSNWIFGTGHRSLVSDSGKTISALKITDYVQYIDVELKNIILNAGDTPLPYEPYGYKIPLTNAGQTTPVYLGEVPTVRRVRKYEFTGTEALQTSGSGNARFFYMTIADARGWATIISDRYVNANIQSTTEEIGVAMSGNSQFRIRPDTTSTVEEYKQYLAAQYAAGTPVTVWYVLANEQTGIVNEPLCKIGDYADELHSTDAAVTIPTAKGQNTLTVDTELMPSEMTINYRE